MFYNITVQGLLSLLQIKSMQIKPPSNAFNCKGNK